ncbi:PIN domain-containing protein [Candidatus Woesearchaeota archaeon]|nr:PIN domain-containing protein [Candidatus Woesearchaeota archaeon]
MSVIGLDTCSIIDIFRGDKSIKKFLINNNEVLSATILSYLELQFGINPDDKDHKEEQKYYDNFFSEILHFRLTDKACKKTSEIHWKLRKKGRKIDQFDCTIAGIFLSNGVNKILTRNTKHFERIDKIRVIRY